MGDMDLTIAIITMNRALQLKEALQSCLFCNLPENTEFVVIDNASTDNTKDSVYDTLTNCSYKFYYEKLPENLGVGGGRNYAFEKSSGKYIYVMDDDAVISEDNKDFFVKSIEYFEKHKEIVTLTTQIYDTAWKSNRLKDGEKEIFPGVYPCKMFCGGSHFIRKNFFKEPPYLNNKYGYEEIPPSLYVVDCGMKNVFCPDLLVIHKPAVDKWVKGSQGNEKISIIDCATPYALKKIIYPRVFGVLLKLAYSKRCKNYLSEHEGAKKQADDLVKNIVKEYRGLKKIKIKTVLREYKKFGISVF